MKLDELDGYREIDTDLLARQRKFFAELPADYRQKVPAADRRCSPTVMRCSMGILATRSFIQKVRVSWRNEPRRGRSCPMDRRRCGRQPGSSR